MQNESTTGSIASQGFNVSIGNVSYVDPLNVHIRNPPYFTIHDLRDKPLRLKAFSINGRPDNQSWVHHEELKLLIFWEIFMELPGCRLRSDLRLLI